MFRITTVDEAPKRSLGIDELRDRNHDLLIYVQPAKADSSWATVTVLQHGIRSTLTSTAPLDRHHGSNFYGQSLFDTSTSAGRQAVTNLIADYMGLAKGYDDVRQALADQLLPPRALARSLRVDAAPIVDWVATRSLSRRPDSVSLTREAATPTSPIKVRSADRAQTRRLTNTELEDRCRGITVDYERTSRLSDPFYMGTVTVMQGGRQHRFEGVRWPKQAHAGGLDRQAFLTSFQDLLGLHDKDRSIAEGLFAARFSGMFATRQAYYSPAHDIDWLLSARLLKKGQERNRIASFDEVVVMGDFLPEPGETLQANRNASDERGSLPEAVVPQYKVTGQTSHRYFGLE